MKKWIIVIFVFSGLWSFGQEAPKGTTIFWDTSLSMEDRVIEKDFEVLQKVFERQKNQEIQLVLFNISSTEKLFSVKDGNWDARQIR